MSFNFWYGSFSRGTGFSWIPVGITAAGSIILGDLDFLPLLAPLSGFYGFSVVLAEDIAWPSLVADGFVTTTASAFLKKRLF